MAAASNTVLVQVSLSCATGVTQEIHRALMTRDAAEMRAPTQPEDLRAWMINELARAMADIAKAQQLIHDMPLSDLPQVRGPRENVLGLE